MILKYILSRVSNNRVVDLQNKLNEFIENNKVSDVVKRVIEKCLGFQFPE